MDKVALVIGSHIYPYRYKFLELLGGHYDLDVYARGGLDSSSFRFNRCLTIELFGLTFQPRVFSLIFSRKYKKIVVVGNLSYISSACLLILGGHRAISWGFWKTDGAMANVVRRYIAQRIHCNILYADSHRHLFEGIPVRTVVARNTVDVIEPHVPKKCYSHMIFVGTLNKRKGLEELLKIFGRLLPLDPSMKLKIVGDGNELDNLIDLAQRLRTDGSAARLGI